MINVLFVCLGNICRSPVAEALFMDMVRQKKMQHLFSADSAGTASYHIGKRADSRSIQVAKNNGITITHLARAFSVTDFDKFDLIVAMDKNNLQDINKLKPKYAAATVVLMRQFDDQFPLTDVPDPYYCEQSDFQNMYRILDSCCNQLLNELVAKSELE